MQTRHLLAAATAAALALPAAAAVESYTIDSRHTFPSFEVNHFGYSLQRGRFNKTIGKATIDPEANKGTLDITIDANSVDTGLDKLEERLRAEDFLNASQYPTITFKGTQFTFADGKLKTVSGDLTMAGATKPVTLEAAFFNCAPHPMLKKKMCGGEFIARIKRSDWGIKYGLPGLADDMLLRINVEAVKDD